MLRSIRFCLLASFWLFLLLQLRAAQFDLSTATISDLNAAFDSGALTSEKLVQLSLARIDAYDKKGPALNTIITLKDRAAALAEARALDAERKAKGPRSPLHGIVVLAKDVYDTADMPTSGGFKPMATSQPSRDSFVIARLRASGAIVLAKLNQSDWYGVASSGGSTLGGQVLTPYNLKKFPGGSSSGTGSAIAAWFGTVGLGSDTTGSIVIPTALNNLVGFSTTHGLVSRTGMMWSSPSQENGGPMARSVYDCAAVLDSIAGYDPADLATQASVGKLPEAPYTSFVKKDGLKGARIGVLREMIRSGPLHTDGIALGEKAIEDMKKAGAVIVDPVLTGLVLHQTQVDASAYPYEVASAIDKYLSALPPSAPIRSVKEMIEKAPDLVKPAIVASAKLGAPDRNPQFAAALKHQKVLRDALIGVMDKYELDALVLPFRTYRIEDLAGMPKTNRQESRNQLASVTGLPAIIVPGGFFDDGMPFAMEFLGRPFSEPKLITVASGYEAVSAHRKSPATTPALTGEKITY
ncbi:amidase [Nibricoccus aquaticus]|uniref:Amidase n=1 Tax=Nibricoccus aquaticus TaxID=2576891 RepID=A0A290QC53_9BACT|nr:amidase family protein [Nibricoccus aquaticus]ATC64780.1 amidase [Nibricoccus aquaticus]